MDSEGKEQPPQPTIPKKGITRRGFLKLGLGVVAGAAATIVAKNIPFPLPDSPSQPQETKEPLKTLSSNVVIIDFAPNEPREGISQTEFPNRELLASPNIPEDVKDYITDSFGSHGENVASAMRKTWERFGFTSTVNLHPVQNALDSQNIEVSPEVEIPPTGFGHKYFLTIDHTKLAEITRQYPDQKVVNLSLQLGKVGVARIEKEKTVGNYELPPGGYIDEDGILSVFGNAGVSATESGLKPMTPSGEVTEPINKSEYEALKKEKEESVTEITSLETPILRKIEAYSREEVEQNLPHLFELCKAFPDKLFVAAAGNEGEDLRGMQDRPANLLIVAEWNRWETKPEHDVYGADIYVDNSALTLPHGSSFSTPAIAALGSIFTNQGLSIEETRQRILQATDLIQGQDTRVLNPDKLKISS